MSESKSMRHLRVTVELNVIMEAGHADNLVIEWEDVQAALQEAIDGTDIYVDGNDARSGATYAVGYGVDIWEIPRVVDMTADAVADWVTLVDATTGAVLTND